MLLNFLNSIAKHLNELVILLNKKKSENSLSGWLRVCYEAFNKSIGVLTSSLILVCLEFFFLKKLIV